MAEELGRRLLAENERNTFSLDEVLASLRQTLSPSAHAYTGIPAVDDLVHAFASTRRRPYRADDAAGTSGLQPPVIQVDGIGPSSGKTQLLYLATARCLLGADPSITLPGTRSSSPLNVSGAVVWFDLSGNFSATRLYDLLKEETQRRSEALGAQKTSKKKPDHHAGDENVPGEEETNRPSSRPLSPTSSQSNRHLGSYPQQNESPLSAQKIEQEAEAALLHVHVLRPQSTPALIDALTRLPEYLFAKPPAHQSGSRPLRLLVLAGLSSFWWQDRYDADLDALGQVEPTPAEQTEGRGSEKQDSSTARNEQQSPIRRTEVADSDEEGSEDLELDLDPEQDQHENGSAQHGQLQPNDGQPESTQHPPSASKPQTTKVHSLPRRVQPGQSIYHQRWRTLTAQVKTVQRRFGCVVLASDLALARPQRERRWRHGAADGRDRAMLRVQPHLPSSWAAGAVTARLLLRRRRRRMPQAISAEEAMEAEEKRIMENQSLRGKDDHCPMMEADIMPNLWGGEDWSREAWQAIGAWEERQCVLQVGKHVKVIGNAEIHKAHQ